LVAHALGIPHIDTGAMYRALALAAMRSRVAPRNAEALARLAEKSQIEFVPGDPPRVLLEGEDVTNLLRTPEISMAASDISAVSAPAANLRISTDINNLASISPAAIPGRYPV